MGAFICDAVIFDLDGVLVDSTPAVERHWRQWAVEHQLDGDAILRVAHGRRTLETIRAIAPHLATTEEAMRLETRAANDADGVQRIDGAAQLLGSVPADAWAIATSGTTYTATNRLHQADLGMPAVLVTAEDVTHGKPHPEAYLRAAARLGVDPARCVVIEDAPAGIEAAHAAGMRVVAVPTTHHPPALQHADVIAAQLRDIQITQRPDPTQGRLVVVVTVTPR